MGGLVHVCVPVRHFADVFDRVRCVRSDVVQLLFWFVRAYRSMRRVRLAACVVRSARDLVAAFLWIARDLIWLAAIGGAGHFLAVGDIPRWPISNSVSCASFHPIGTCGHGRDRLFVPRFWPNLITVL